jgi:flagella basal body P-ring formation protein FlgA
MRRSTCLIALGLVVAPAAAGEPIHPLATITAAVRQHVAGSIDAGADVEIAVGRLDPRLRLPACDRALDVRYANGRPLRGPASVEVRCEGAAPWALYVPVSVERYAEVVVAARPLARGAVIAEADVTLARSRVSGATSDYFEALDAVVDQVATRAISAGQVLGSQQIERPRLVRRGDEVILATEGGAISVRVKAEALADGAAGDRVTVRNLASERVVEGEVRGAGLVVVRAGALL